MADKSHSPRRGRDSPPGRPRGPRDDERRGERGSDRSGNQSDRDRNYGRDRDRDRDFDRPRDRDRDRDHDRDHDRERRPRNRGGFKWKDERRDDNRRRDDRPPRRRSLSPRRRDRDRDEGSSRDKKERKPAVPAPAPVGGGEEMIIVHVNDRLGTKAAIPCYPSDRIKEFKLMVAARIGRESHELLLKRQGERPFKDALTLEDYGVGNGVQLDLEVDTGD